MKLPPGLPPARVAGFRVKLLGAIMLVVSATALLALYFAERSLATNFADALEREFKSELAALRHAQEVRSAALVERCRTLVRKPRIRAAFEDDAFDLLYPNAEDELRDILVGRDDNTGLTLRAVFYRFLDHHGAVIAPPTARTAGPLRPEEQAQLSLPRLPLVPQVGYLVRQSDRPDRLTMTLAVPILSSESSEPTGALVLGFNDVDAPVITDSSMKRGLWLGGRLYSANLSPAALVLLTERLPGLLTNPAAAASPLPVTIEQVPHLLFFQPINPGSLFPPAHEVWVYPLTGMVARQRELRWQILGTGGALLLLGLAVSHVLATRLARPVERLAVDSEVDRTQRARAEAALETTHAELQRSARFSADASHQLKTPVAVLRAGLEEIQTRENLSPAECLEISALIHQTFRLSSLIDDLLLLSRLDAGRLKLALDPVNLSLLIEAALDDLSALPDDLGLEVTTDYPSGLHIAGEKRYTAIILQNLLENARKYNRPGGQLQLRASVAGETVRLTVRNSGRPIPPESQAHIFERFHRGAVGENVPGYGLGLNLARELARLHQGDLRLLRSDADGTEFEVCFRLAAAAPAGPPPA